MYISNITDDYNDTLTTNITDAYNDTLATNNTDDYNDSLSKNNNCANNEINTDKTVPTLLLTIPFGLSFLCLMSLMVYTINKHLFNSK